MGTMAKLTIIGNVGADPRRGETNGVPYANFRVAHSYNRKPKAEGEEAKKFTTWYSVSVFGPLTRVCEFIKEGSKVYIEGGEPRIDAYGQRISIAVTAKSIVLLDRKPAEADVEADADAVEETETVDEIPAEAEEESSEAPY